MKLQTERMETCMAWRFAMNSEVALPSKCFQSAVASFPILLFLCIRKKDSNVDNN